MPTEPPDLTALNAAEREALALLASGHTAKSIATLTGRTEGAVNERLREARRKTGVGSSRELARLLRDQENRDELIGMARPPATPADDRGRADERRRRSSKGFVMAIALTTLAAMSLGAAILTGSAQTDTPPRDEKSPEALHDRFVHESRDTDWAARTEAALLSRYRAIAGVSPGPQVHCARTICEVTGAFRDEGGATAIDRTMRVMQGRELLADMRTLGFDEDAQRFDVDLPAKHATFTVYWARSMRVSD